MPIPSSWRAHEVEPVPFVEALDAHLLTLRQALQRDYDQAIARLGQKFGQQENVRATDEIRGDCNEIESITSETGNLRADAIQVQGLEDATGLGAKLQEVNPGVKLIEPQRQISGRSTVSSKVSYEIVAEREGTFTRTFSGRSQDEDRLRVPARWWELSVSLCEADAAGILVKRQHELELEFHSGWTQRPNKPKVSFVTRNSIRTSIRDATAIMEEPGNGMDWFDENIGLWRYIVVHPESDKRLAWNLFGIALICWDMITIPLSMFDLGRGNNRQLEVLSFIAFGYWLTDFFLHFIFGVDIDGKLVMSPFDIAKLYIKGRWFFLDLFLISLDVSLFTLEGLKTKSDGIQSARMLRGIRLLRFIKVIRISRMRTLVNLFTRRFTNIFLLTIVKVLSGLGMMLIVNHFIACAFIGLGSQEFDGKSWLNASGLQEASFVEVYAYALHWSLTQFMPATNNIAPDNTVERFFAVAVILLAMGVFSSFISSITNAVNTLRAVTSEKREEQSKLRQFFSERQLSTGLYTMVTDYISTHGIFQLKLQESSIKSLKELPSKLKFRLHLEVHLATLTTAHWLNAGVINSDPMFFYQVCHEMVVERISGPGGEVFHSEAECADVFIVTAGTWSYHKLGAEEIIDCPNFSWVCEVALWSSWHHRGRLSSECSSTYCTINGCKFADLALRRGGRVHQCLKVIGILIAGEIEDVDADGLSDLSLGEEILSDISARSLLFLDMVARGKSQISVA